MPLTLTQADFTNLAASPLHSAWRLKILKAQGANIPFESFQILNVDGSVTDPHTDGADYKQVIRDSFGDRNRTIVLHDVAGDVTTAVVSIIDHADSNKVYKINKNTSAGWVALNTHPPHMLFDEETNMLYISWPNAGSPDMPRVFKINCETMLDELVAGSCHELKPNPDALKCENIFIGDGGLCFATNNHYSLLAMRHGKLYIYWNNDDANFGDGGTAPHHFGYFQADGTFIFQWCWGNVINMPGYADPRLTLLKLPEGYGAGGYDYLRSWYYDKKLGVITMAFRPRAVGISFGYEANIVDIDLDGLIDHVDSIETFNDTHFDLPNWSTCVFGQQWFSYLACSGWSQATAWPVIDFFGSGILECFAYFEGFLSGVVHNDIGVIASALDIETPCSASSPNGGVIAGHGGDPHLVSGGAFIHETVQLDPTDPRVRFITGSFSQTGGTYFNCTDPSRNPIGYQDAIYQPGCIWTIFLRRYPNSALRAVNVLSPDPLRQIGDINRPQTELAYCPQQEFPQMKTKDLGDTLSTSPELIFKRGNFFYVAMYSWDEGNLGSGLGLWRVRDDGKELTRYTAQNSLLFSNDIKSITPVNDQSLLIASGDTVQYFNTDTGEFGYAIQYSPVDFGIMSEKQSTPGTYVYHNRYGCVVEGWKTYPTPTIYINNVIVDPSKYTINYTDGEVAFWPYPQPGDEVKVTFCFTDYGSLANNYTEGMSILGATYGGDITVVVSQTNLLIIAPLYEGVNFVTRVPLSTMDNYNYYYVPVSDAITNWYDAIPPFIERNGVQVDPSEYTIDYLQGLVAFNTSQAGKTITASFGFYGNQIWQRSPRVWWNGNNADLILGDNDTVVIDERGRVAGIMNPTFNHSKGQASYDFSFDVEDANYLPWVFDSPFNENQNAPGTYSGTLEDGGRMILERGLQNDNGEWTWFPEGQIFITSEPATAREGFASMRCECKGVIGALLTRSIYEGVHKPDTAIVTGGTLTTVDDKIYYYVESGNQIVDWATFPAPKVYVNGVLAANYTLHSSSGEVEFHAAQTGATITADFTHYVAGTNEAEDIIICILRYPNKLGGVGLDDTYFTRNILNETLTTTDHLTYSFSKNNIRPNDAYNKIFVDGVQVNSGFTGNYRNGTITFNTSKAGHVVTGQCTYFTIQKSGITLRDISFRPKDQHNAYDCINEVVRRVAPNYVFHEDVDGKLICDFYTQKPDGSEDIVVEDSDVAITSFADNPMYNALATYVISYGQSPLSELPDLCGGKTVTNLWPWAWHPGTDFQLVVDGDVNTQIDAGYGRWDEGTYDNQVALRAAGDTGIPMISIDLLKSYKVETIVMARGNQTTGEGLFAGFCTYSLWVSNDGSGWTKLVDAFALPPGQNITLKAGTNFDADVSFRYIRVNCHSLGLYNWKGHLDSQISLAEIQCYETEYIEGSAKLQLDDPALPNYDVYGLLNRYGGHLVCVARNGQPDPALYTQDKVNDDAQNILDEFMRLIAQVEIDSPNLPGLPLFKTVKITNGALQRTVTFFIESKSLSLDSDKFTGTTLP